MKRALTALLAIGCCELGATQEETFDTAEQAVTSETIGFRVSDRPELVQPLLNRWNHAACLDLQVETNGQHSVTFTEEGYAKGRIGQTTGTWENADIRVKTVGWKDNQIQIVLMHELAHLLALTNEHQPLSVMSADKGFEAQNQHITAALLARVCTVRECGCFSPER